MLNPCQSQVSMLGLVLYLTCSVDATYKYTNETTVNEYNNNMTLSQRNLL